MNIPELNSFSHWLIEQFRQIKPAYQKLESVLAHNSTQPQQNPVEDPLDNLRTIQESIDLDVCPNSRSVS
jgi:hypothetical protein